MRKLTILMAASAVLTSCLSAPEAEQSCADLARARADARIEWETALLEQLETGSPDKSDLQRSFIAMDAEEYRMVVYEECQRRRGLDTEDE